MLRLPLSLRFHFGISLIVYVIKPPMSKLQSRYDKLDDKLKELKQQKCRIKGDAIMDAYLKSGKNFDEVMTFLNP